MIAANKCTPKTKARKSWLADTLKLPHAETATDNCILVHLTTISRCLAISFSRTKCSCRNCAAVASCFFLSCICLKACPVLHKIAYLVNKYILGQKMY
uniref:Uncharacterized protein n=1 Tax=Arundo donax TaxID=35708 RepID=A0A0A8YI97_ARUDO